MDIICSEEEKFLVTLDKGIELFEEQVLKLKKLGTKQIPGEVVFRLHDTFGFPVDLTEILALEHGLLIDISEYNEIMSKQKRASSKASKFITTSDNTIDWIILKEAEGTFIGYNETECHTNILRYRNIGKLYEIVLEKSHSNSFIT
jgi:alanyl-tRNA synthetase